MKEILRTEYEKGRADAIAETQVAWSEEDDIMKQNCHQMLALLRPNSSDLIKETIDNCHHWLKDLKQRITNKQ